MNTAEATARLDRLPIGRPHRLILVGVIFAFAFELADLNAFTYVAPALKQYQHLSVAQISLITSASFIGMFVGATVGGRLADLLGRRVAMITATTWYSVFCLINAAAPNVIIQFIVRLLTGVGMAALTVIAITYLAEMMPRARRGRMQAFALGIAVIGVPVMSFFSRIVDPLGPNGWRLVFCFGALGLIAVPIIVRMPESPRWLIARGQSDRAAEIVTRLERLSPVSLAELPPPDVTAARPEARKAPLSDLVRGKMLRRSIMLWIVWAAQTLGFFGFTAWVPTLLASHGVDLVHSLGFAAVTTLGAVPGSLFAYVISDRFSRKLPLIATCIAIVVFGVLYGVSTAPAAVMIFGFLVEFFLWTFAALLYAYTPELYPTSLRNTGSGIAYGIGRLVNIAGAPIVAVIFGSLGYVSVFIYVALCWLVTALAIAILGPRTGDVSLEELQRDPDDPTASAAPHASAKGILT